MTESTAQKAKEALQPIAKMLDADGFSLEIGSCEDNLLELSVEVTSAACSDCLIPRELFKSMAEKALSEKGLKAELIVTYPSDIRPT